MKSPAGRASWLTRNVLAIAMLSLFSDMGHELTTAVLPLFLATFGGAAAALGMVEGVSDAASSALKLWMSIYSDRVGKRKPLLVVGYIVTAMMGTLAFVTAWWQMLLIRTAAWMGRGRAGQYAMRCFPRVYQLKHTARVFGFEGALDTMGAVIGPAIALSLVGVIALRHIFLIAFIPGAVTVLIVLFVVQDIPKPAQPHLRMIGALRDLPSTFWRYVAAVAVFGLGNFAHTLLVLRAVTLLTPRYGPILAGRYGIALYILHNVVYAAVSYPAGALGDRVNKKTLLCVGYALFGIMCLLFITSPAGIPMLAFLFVLAGVYVGIVDAMERALAADILPLARRGVGYGALATANSFGDLLSSIIVGELWAHISAAAGFTYAAVFTLLGAFFLLLVPSVNNGSRLWCQSLSGDECAKPDSHIPDDHA